MTAFGDSGVKASIVPLSVLNRLIAGAGVTVFALNKSLNI